jgi:hypothetical protein
VIALPPLLAGGVNVTVASVLAAVALPIVGAPGAVAAIVIEKACVALPIALVATTTPLKVPTALGVPASAPLLLRLRPVGSEPLAKPNVGAGEPVAAYAWE